MQIDAVEERSADFRQVALDDTRGAAAFACPIAVKTAGTGIHGGNQHDPGRERQGAVTAGDRDGAFFERLPKLLEPAAWKFRQLIQKQNALMGQADLAG